jgi:hypothetical protein
MRYSCDEDEVVGFGVGVEMVKGNDNSGLGWCQCSSIPSFLKISLGIFLFKF